MDKDKADKIIRDVFYKNLPLMEAVFDPDDTDTAFLVGRVMGKMQKTLEDMLDEIVNDEKLEDEEDGKEWSA